MLAACRERGRDLAAGAGVDDEQLEAGLYPTKLAAPNVAMPDFAHGRPMNVYLVEILLFG